MVAISWNKGNMSLLLMEEQTSTVTMKINIMVLQTVGNCFVSRSRYTYLEHTPRILSILPQGHFLNHVYCGFIHKSWKLETTYMSLSGRMDKQNVGDTYNEKGISL